MAFRNWQCSDKTINDIESSGILSDKGRSPSWKTQPSPGRQGRRRSWRGERVAQTIMRDLVSGSLPGSRQFHEDARGAKPRVRWKINYCQDAHASAIGGGALRRSYQPRARRSSPLHISPCVYEAADGFQQRQTFQEKICPQNLWRTGLT